MTLGQIREQVDHIRETWRGGAPPELRTDLADLDAALAKLDGMEPDTQTEIEAADQLRGRIEVLMDEIDINLGIGPEPIDIPDAFDDLAILERAFEEEVEAVVNIDDPKARSLISAVGHHLATSSSPGVLQEDLEAIDALDDDGSPTLKTKLHRLRAEVEQQLSEQESLEEARLPPGRSGRPGSFPVGGR